jgi:hypothetical protein
MHHENETAFAASFSEQVFWEGLHVDEMSLAIRIHHLQPPSQPGSSRFLIPSHSIRAAFWAVAAGHRVMPPAAVCAAVEHPVRVLRVVPAGVERVVGMLREFSYAR